MLCLSYADLRARGIRFSRQWLNVMIKSGDFPRPLKLGKRSVAFDASEIEAWLQNRAKERDKSPQTKADLPIDGAIHSSRTSRDV